MAALYLAGFGLRHVVHHGVLENGGRSGLGRRRPGARCGCSGARWLRWRRDGGSEGGHGTSDSGDAEEAGEVVESWRWRGSELRLPEEDHAEDPVARAGGQLWVALDSAGVPVAHVRAQDVSGQSADQVRLVRACDVGRHAEEHDPSLAIDFWHQPATEVVVPVEAYLGRLELPKRLEPWHHAPHVALPDVALGPELHRLPLEVQEGLQVRPGQHPRLVHGTQKVDEVGFRRLAGPDDGVEEVPRLVGRGPGPDVGVGHPVQLVGPVPWRDAVARVAHRNCVGGVGLALLRHNGALLAHLAQEEDTVPLEGCNPRRRLEVEILVAAVAQAPRHGRAAAALVLQHALGPCRQTLRARAEKLRGSLPEAATLALRSLG
mmetsp:Transcript_26405/g.78926  ORF Transcript_26405/g.78926 Transcript_26405/m.78926 type:complete len:376 (-) Transcript_26405:245-1372(-)